MRIITIGREQDNTIVLHNPKVSRHHCRIMQHSDGRLEIEDLNSTNGTFVNGRPVRGMQRISRGDQIVVGDITVAWQGYFSPAGAYGRPQRQPEPREEKSYTGVIIGSVAAIIIVGVILVLAFAGVFKGKSNTRHEKQEARTVVMPRSTEQPKSRKLKQYDGVYTNVPGGNNTGRRSAVSETKRSFAGTWWYEDDNIIFDLDLQQEGDHLYGSYSTLNKVTLQLDGETFVDGTISGANATVNVKSESWGGHGVATLTKRSDGSLKWHFSHIDGMMHVAENVTLRHR